MSNILILNTIIPFPENFNGNSIRVLPISREVSKEHTCFLASFGHAGERLSGLEQTDIYKDILLLPEPVTPASIRRFFYPRTGDLRKISHPSYFKCVSQLINEYIDKNNINLVLTHTLYASQFMEDIHGIPMIIDDTDCHVLSLTRSSNYRKTQFRWQDKIKSRRAISRALHRESHLTEHFNFVTTVSPVDRKVLRNIAPASSHNRIIDIPNGVTESISATPSSHGTLPNTIAFWGSLDFPPNKTAVSYFYNEVYLPYLKDTDIIWYIIGGNPDKEIIDMGNSHEHIIVTGFVDNLFELVRKIPIMINPMKIGGGLKNKVLEAFALERLVISTSLGMEAVPAEEKVHYLCTDEPGEFANLILQCSQSPDKLLEIGARARNFVLDNYAWDKIGKQFLGLIDRAIDEGAIHK